MQNTTAFCSLSECTIGCHFTFPQFQSCQRDFCKKDFGCFEIGAQEESRAGELSTSGL